MRKDKEMPTTGTRDKSEEQNNMPPQNVKAGLLWLSIVLLAGAAVVFVCFLFTSAVLP
jgi:cell division septal protein FtsQ